MRYRGILAPSQPEIFSDEIYNLITKMLDDSLGKQSEKTKQDSGSAQVVAQKISSVVSHFKDGMI